MNVPARRGRASRGLALVSVAFAIAMLVPSLASAASSNFNAFVSAQYGNTFCGDDHPELQSLASVWITKKGPWLTVRTEIDGTPATADTDYDVYAFNGVCSQLGLIGTVHTNAFGVSSVLLPRFKMPAGTTSVFISLDGPNGWNDTPIVP